MSMERWQIFELVIVIIIAGIASNKIQHFVTKPERQSVSSSICKRLCAGKHAGISFDYCISSAITANEKQK